MPVIRGSHNFKIGSGDPGHAHLGVILRFIRRKDPSSTSVPNLKQIALFVADNSIRPKIVKFGHVTQATHTYGSFYGPHAGAAILHLRTKLEADCSIRSKVIKGVLKFGN